MKLHGNTKKSTIFVLVIALLFSALSFPTTAFAIEAYDFANFTEADSMAFVYQCGIDIPEKLSQSEYLPSITLEIILQSYNNPNVPFHFNYSKTQTYAEDIREAVISYMNLGSIPTVASTTSYTLQDSKVMDENGNWVTSGGYYNDKWVNYNCYAYSINRGEQPQYYSSGWFIQYQPGNMSDQGSFDDCTTIDQLVNIVYADLVAMGYSNISSSYIIPTIDSSQELICVRMLYDVDYHFMRYDLETNSWYHKPSYTAVLKYNYTPSNNLLWSNECSYNNIEYPSGIEYDSDIVFISYSKNQINISSNVTSREYIQPNKDVFCELNFVHSCNHQIELSSSNSVKYEIYNDDFDIISSGSGTDIDINMNINKGKYYLRMNFESYTNLSYVDVSINTHPYTDRFEQHSSKQHKAYCECGEYVFQNHVIQNNECIACGEPHTTHDYSDHFVHEDSTTHKSYCICGGYIISGHVVSNEEYISGKRYATCLACGGMASLGMIHHQGIGALPRTENGSFILPDGIIVLVDEDIEAYLVGTLEFIYPDGNLETE